MCTLFLSVHAGNAKLFTHPAGVLDEGSGSLLRLGEATVTYAAGIGIPGPVDYYLPTYFGYLWSYKNIGNCKLRVASTLDEIYRSGPLLHFTAAVATDRNRYEFAFLSTEPPNFLTCGK